MEKCGVRGKHLNWMVKYKWNKLKMNKKEDKWYNRYIISWLLILSHGEDRNKAQELQSTAIDNSTPAFRVVGDKLTDDNTNGKLRVIYWHYIDLQCNVLYVGWILW